MTATMLTRIETLAGADIGGERDEDEYPDTKRLVQEAAERRRHYLASEIRCSPILVLSDCEALADEYLREHAHNELPLEELTERFYLVRGQRNKLLWACQKALAAFDAALLSNGVGSTWSGKDVDEMRAAVAECGAIMPGE